MDLTEDEKIIRQQAQKYIVDNEDALIQRFVTSKNPLRLGTVSLFMAGSPGAGKTEFSKRYLPGHLDKEDADLAKLLSAQDVDMQNVDTLFIRIDVDEIREFLPNDLYKKADVALGVCGNAHIVHPAATSGLDIIREYCFQNNISFLLDGTFGGHYSTMKELIRKSLKLGRQVQIFYLYLDPLVAWEFTKAREYLEGRNIVKEKFIDQFFASRENVKRAKKDFGAEVKLHVIVKNKLNDVDQVRLNVPDIDSFFQKQYSKQLITEYTKEDLLNLIS